MRNLAVRFFIVVVCLLLAGPALLAREGFSYIHTSFENASPLYWDVDEEGTIQLYLLYDHERDSTNRAAGHWYFRIEGQRGAKLTFVINNLENVWNGKKASPAKESTITLISEDNKEWSALPMELLEGNRLKFSVTMPADRLYVARVEPYRITDLQRLLTTLKPNPQIDIIPIGKTVENRPLEIIRAGSENAPHRIFIRARSHPWEPGGNWFIEGLLDGFLEDTAKAWHHREKYCLYIMPMANKDGVARGWTRFNVNGMDLNRKWDAPADPVLNPENAALENWLQQQIDKQHRPDLAIDLHNDQGGNLHVSRPNIHLDTYLAKAKRLESLMLEHTWFREGATGGSFRNPGSLGEGFLERYGIDGFILELNASWIKGLNDYPSAQHWKLFGNQMLDVFDRYFD